MPNIGDSTPITPIKQHSEQNVPVPELKSPLTEKKPIGESLSTEIQSPSQSVKQSNLETVATQITADELEAAKPFKDELKWRLPTIKNMLQDIAGLPDREEPDVKAAKDQAKLWNGENGLEAKYNTLKNDLENMTPADKVQSRRAFLADFKALEKAWGGVKLDHTK